MIWWLLGSAIVVIVGLVFVIRYGDRLAAEPVQRLHADRDDLAGPADRISRLRHDRAA